MKTRQQLPPTARSSHRDAKCKRSSGTPARLLPIALLLLGSLLAACSSGGGGGGGGGNLTPEQGAWDTLIWDQDAWQ